MRTVWVNGCFDVIHHGHIRLLDFAKTLGDWLVVGLNDDASVRALKGPDRPVFKLSVREETLRSLRCVDDVVVFSSLDPLPAIKTYDRVIDVIVKGLDYADRDFPERHLGCSLHFYDSGLTSHATDLIARLMRE